MLLISTLKLTQLLVVLAFYSEWLNGKPEISSTERIKLVTRLGPSLAQANSSRTSRGVNRVLPLPQEGQDRVPRGAGGEGWREATVG